MRMHKFEFSKVLRERRLSWAGFVLRDKRDKLSGVLSVTQPSNDSPPNREQAHVYTAAFLSIATGLVRSV